MDQEPRTAGSPVSAEPEGDRSPEQIQADIERTRLEVGDTVEALAAKTDVKGRAQERVAEVKANLHAKKDELGSKARESTPGGAQDGAQQAVAVIRRNPAPFAIGSAITLGYLLARLRDRRRP